jgi:hypothetical protein
MGLTPEERDEWARRFRDEAHDEHQRRMQKAAHPATAKDDAWEEARKEAEIARIRTHTRNKFWEENGYVRYVDSRGAEIWLTQAESERRTAKRKRRQKVFTPDWGGRTARGLMLLGVIALAIVIGLFIGR